MATLAIQLAQAIRQVRRRRRLSQEKLAARAGIHRTYMSAIERGKANMSIGVASRLAEALGMTLSELLRRAEDFAGTGRGERRRA